MNTYNNHYLLDKKHHTYGTWKAIDEVNAQISRYEHSTKSNCATVFLILGIILSVVSIICFILAVTDVLDPYTLGYISGIFMWALLHFLYYVPSFLERKRDN